LHRSEKNGSHVTHITLEKLHMYVHVHVTTYMCMNSMQQSKYWLLTRLCTYVHEHVTTYMCMKAMQQPKYWLLTRQCTCVYVHVHEYDLTIQFSVLNYVG
jgi:hypothetical protein